MTLMEVIVALGIMAIMMAGILAALMQTRRLSSASVAQNCALTIVQGYVEQLKNMPLNVFVNAAPNDQNLNPNLNPGVHGFNLFTVKDQSLPVGGLNPTSQLWTTPTSSASLASLLGATPGVTPTGAVDNLQRFDMDNVANATPTTWAAIWPNGTSGANTTLTPYPVYNASYPNDNNWQPGTTDLHMNFWVQIWDLTPTATSMCKAYGFVIVYTWQYVDGGRVRYAMDSVRSVRSAVQTF